MKLKKRILTILLSGLMLANLNACDDVTNGGIPNETTNESGSTEDITEPKIKAEGIMACNGCYYNSDTTYTINQNNELTLYVDSWNETFVIRIPDMHVVAETVQASSVVLWDDQGIMVFGDFSQPAKPIKMIRLAKGNPQVTIENISYETNVAYAFNYCSFIDEQIGYLLHFGGENNQLSKMVKTVDGGKTWETQKIENVPSFCWNDRIICAKMIDEKIGFISAGHRADDNFSKRTYITADGGENWNSIVLPPNDYYTRGDSNSQDTYIPSGEAYDFLYQDGLYILCLRQKRENDFVYFKYVSTDLTTWSFVES